MALPKQAQSSPDIIHSSWEPPRASDKAGPYSIAELEALLAPVLEDFQGAGESKWLPGQTILFALGSSGLMWVAIWALATRLI